MHACAYVWIKQYVYNMYLYIYITCVAFPGTNLGSMELVSRFLFCHAAMPSVAQHGFTVSVSRRSI